MQPTMEDTKQQVTRCMIKLSDRDTEPSASAELESLLRSLPISSLPIFLSAISTRPSDKTPLRRHSLRILSLLPSLHSPSHLRPHLPKIISSLLLRRLRDSDSSVRSALVSAVSSLSPIDPPLFLRHLSDCLLHEQDIHSQSSSALCLSAAIDSSENPDLDQIRRLLPRLVKLVRSNGFKAKAALIGVIGSGVAAVGGGVAGEGVVGCVAEFLGSEDWMARKAAAEALERVAVAEREVLGVCEWKDVYIAKFEARRFDKVKIVREAMNKMIEVWKDLPGADNGRESTSSTGSVTRKAKTTTSRSPPTNATPVTATRKKSERKEVHMTKTDSDLNVEVVAKGKEGKLRSRFEVKKMLFDEDKGGKLMSRVVPVVDSGRSEIVGEFESGFEDHHGGIKEGELSLIQKQLVQIENQQSSLLELLQKFIGSSQNGIRCLESRVHGLEMTLDGISRDLAVSSGRMSNNIDSEVKTCCSLPGAEFLSSRFRRREAGRYSLSGNQTLSGMHFLAEKQGGDSYIPRSTLRSDYVNPLAEINTQSSRNAEVIPKRMLKTVIRDSRIKHGQDG